jgi:hypothetical protein
VINLTQINTFLHYTESISGLTNMDQHHWVFVLDNLWGNYSSISSECCFDHHLNCIRLKANIIMTEQEKGSSINHQSRLIAGSTETLVFVKRS